MLLLGYVFLPLFASCLVGIAVNRAIKTLKSRAASRWLVSLSRAFFYGPLIMEGYLPTPVPVAAYFFVDGPIVLPSVLVPVLIFVASMGIERELASERGSKQKNGQSRSGSGP